MTQDVGQIMDGKAVARDVLARAGERAAKFEAEVGRKPCLATVLVGSDEGSHMYVKMKANRAREIGVHSRRHELPETTTTEELTSLITELSEDDSVDGILLQHPVPDGIDERAAFECISVAKDVDGVTMESFARISFGLPAHACATPGAIMRILDAYDVDPTGKVAVVVGRSPILGKPVGMMLLQRNATVVYCHSRTTDLAAMVALGDIIVAAVGVAELIRGEWIKPGAVVIDAGYNAGNVGDVEYDAAAERASMITPVPGGVGPVTISLLLDQTVQAAYDLAGLDG